MEVAVEALKESLFRNLVCALSHDHVARKTAEEELRVLEVMDDFGVVLCGFITDHGMDLPVRQLSCILLRQYVDCHWSGDSEKFAAPQTPDESKDFIRRVLPHALSDDLSHIRSTAAYALAAIACWDWPESWPDLVDWLVQALASSNSNLIHGVMRFLTEFSREITDAKIPELAPILFPQLLRIFSDIEKYSIRTRGRVVQIFSTLSNLLSQMKEYHKGAGAALLFPILPQYIEAFLQCLSLPEKEGIVDSGLKMDIFRCLTVLMRGFPRHMTNFFSQILPVTWSLLTQSVDKYLNTTVRCTEFADDPVDSDGECLNFENFVYGIFDFILAVIEIPKLRSAIKKVIHELIYYVILYQQITEDQAAAWLSDPNQFVEDEDEDTLSYSVRISAEDLLMALYDERQFSGITATAVTDCVSRLIQEANPSDSHSWKVHEACMLALGDVVEIVSSGKTRFDVTNFFSVVVLKDLSCEDCPFLIGRCLWLASKYSKFLPRELSAKFVEASVAGLSEAYLPAVRVSAARALKGFCLRLEKDMLKPYLLPAFDGILTIATQSLGGVLGLVLEVLIVLMKVDDEVTASFENRLGPLAIGLYLKHGEDFGMASMLEEVFSLLAQNPLTAEPLKRRFVPTVISILKSDSNQIPPGLKSSGLDVVESIVRHSAKPLDAALLNDLFPVIINSAIHSDDNAIMQNACECARAYVVTAAQQLALWNDDSGHNGLEYVVELACQLLQPSRSEHSASFIGQLVSCLIHHTGTYLSTGIVEPLMRSVLTKLQQAKTQSVIQSLIVVFAQLFNQQLDAVVDFLDGVPDPSGNSALHFVLSHWCACQPFFYGAYEVKVSIVALSQLLQFGAKTKDMRLQAITVKGEEVSPISDTGIKTRSKAAQAPTSWTMIPVLVKIFKLLLSEVRNQLESNASGKADGQNDSSENEWEDESDDDENDDDEETVAFLTDLASLAKQQDYEDGDDDTYKDEDFKVDPNYSLNLLAYLKSFLNLFKKEEFFQEVIQCHLSKIEIQTLLDVS
ncbi:importin-9-like [Oscarella lobularis]|uniref:importin-9-like n=1 Tax=Oscarella lobularis TaxID=121494 RepID=UPI0033130D4B